MADAQTFETREQWLVAAKQALEPIFKQAGYTIPKKVRVGCGYPATGGTRRSKSGSMTIGQCLMNCSADDHHEIFIHPIQDAPILPNGSGVLETLTHELLHAALPPKTGHKKLFARGCKALDLVGKPTATLAGPKLIKQLEEIAQQLGKYPHGSLNFSGTKQKTKLLAVRCTQCECVVRMTRKWLDEVGAPTCGCGAPMQEQERQDDDMIKLKTLEQMVVYETPDTRFSIRFIKDSVRGSLWYLIDHEDNSRLIHCDDKEDCFTTIEAIREGMTVTDEDEFEEFEEDEGEYEDFEGLYFPLNHLVDSEPSDYHLHDDEIEEHDVPEDNNPADPFPFERAKGITEGAWAKGRDPYEETEPASVLPASYPKPNPETVKIFGAANLRS